MKKIILILSILVITKTSLNAQSAIALFKPTYGGDEHYGFSTGSTEDEARQKALNVLASTVNEKVAANTVGVQFIYESINKKGWHAIGRGKDQYGHYLHYEAALGYDSEEAAKQHVLARLSARGLYDVEIFSSGLDE